MWYMHHGEAWEGKDDEWRKTKRNWMRYWKTITTYRCEHIAHCYVLLHVYIMQGSEETLSLHTWEGWDRSVHHINDHWWYGPEQNKCATSKKGRKISLQFMATENTSYGCVDSWSLGCSLFWPSSVAPWSQPDYECFTSHPFGMIETAIFWPEYNYYHVY